MKKLKPEIILLAAGNLIFALLYVLLSVNNRPAPDDFHFLHNVSEHGVFRGLATEYQNWSTRWMSVLLNHTVLFFYQRTTIALTVFGIISLLAFTAAVFLFVRNLHTRTGIVFTRNVFLQAGISVFIVNALFLATGKVGETWFWLCASCTYLWSVIMLFAGAAWLISTRKHPLFFAAGVLSFLYIGGSSEPLALIVLQVLAVLLMLKHFTKTSIVQISSVRLGSAFLSCLAACIILRLGEGNINREAHFEEAGLIGAFLLNFKMSGKIFLQALPPTLPWLVLLSLPAICAGALRKTANPTGRLWKKLAFLSAIYVLVIFLYQFPVTYKTQDIAADRALFPVTLFTLVFAALFFYYTGRQLSAHVDRLRAALILPLSAALCMNAYLLTTQAPAAFAYAKAWDARTAFLLEHKDQDTLLIPQALPPAGLLFSAEISEDTAHFSNRHLRAGMGLKCRVAAPKADPGEKE